MQSSNIVNLGKVFVADFEVKSTFLVGRMQLPDNIIGLDIRYKVTESCENS